MRIVNGLPHKAAVTGTLLLLMGASALAQKGNINWVEDYDTGRAQAAAQEKAFIVHFSSSG
jgi:hypothetical protein